MEQVEGSPHKRHPGSLCTQSQVEAAREGGDQSMFLFFTDGLMCVGVGGGGEGNGGGLANGPHEEIRYRSFGNRGGHSVCSVPLTSRYFILRKCLYTFFSSRVGQCIYCIVYKRHKHALDKDKEQHFFAKILQAF